MLHWFAWAAITKYHTLGDFHSRNVFPKRSGGQNSELKVPAEPVSPEAPLRLQMAAFVVCPGLVFPLWLCIPRLSLCIPWPPSCKNSSHGTSLMVQWLRLRPSNAGDTGSIPGQGTKIPHAVSAAIKKKKKNSSHTDYSPCSVPHF